MWLGDWFLIEETNKDTYNAIHKYYIKDGIYNANYIQNIKIYKNDINNLFGYKQNDYNRFWEKVSIPTDYENNCWEWIAGIFIKDGYGQFKIQSDISPMGSHRFSYQMFYGPIPKCFIPNWQYLEVMHSCNNRLCCNPNHLSVGDTKLNSEYMVETNRSLTNESNPFSKYSNKLLLEIFEKVQNEKITSIQQIIDEYNMTFSEVHAIFDGRIRNTLTKDYNLKQLKKKISQLNLTNVEVKQIRNLLNKGIRATEIAKMYNRSKECIYGIKYNKYYVNVI